jgi:hypothetical protein
VRAGAFSLGSISPAQTPSGAAADHNAVSKQPLTPQDPCVRKGPTAGYNEAAMKKAHEDVKAFLLEVRTKIARIDWATPARNHGGSLVCYWP